ncbi:MAG: C-type lectin domain-containing protein [Nannocystaceae bacterium]
MRARPRLGPAWALSALGIGGACFVDAPGDDGASTAAVTSTTSTATTATSTTSTSTSTTAASISTSPSTDASSTDASSTASTEGSTTLEGTRGCVDAEFFVDGDGDGFGDPEASVVACDPPPGYVPAPGDCDDGDPDVHPGADELCDDLDNDCDDATDEWSATNTACGGCDMQLAGASVFHRCPTLMDFAGARVACQGRGGDLAIPETPREHDLLAAWIAGNAASWWIGLEDQVNEGDFRWVDGGAPTTTWWAKGEPNNLEDEDCVEVNAATGLWNDAQCGLLRPFLCESPAS